MRSLIYFLRESVKGFSRNLSTALGSIVTIFLSLLIIGIFLMGGIVIENIVSSVESEVSITAYIADEASEADISKTKSFIEGLEGVASVGFTTKDQALENFRNSMTSNPEIIDQLDGENPLPASIDVELSDPQLVEQVADSIESNSTFASICDNPSDPSESLKYGQKTVEKLFSLTSYIRYIGIALVALLIFIAMVFINNTIRLAILARRKEIAIMRLVGASNGFIRGPFLMEGALHALIGSLLSVGALELLRRFALPQLQNALTWLPIDIGGSIMAMIYVALIVAGLVIGLIGSAFAMGRYLKV
ncbi:permease-like cell division protein FtsX [Adlercreutzia sp. ZJ138]|uniref:permease-like cell division protein FtsX n=1 Tax=Adlercreutzia sp. ZJ138 TaxID=2709405 RepID=UPI0013EAE34F|nr:permease-like cell division protein FtsX [Adlercreutzia sp. ZJ138]